MAYRRVFPLACACLSAAAQTFQQPATIAASRIGTSVASVVSADFNRDGIPDLAASNLFPPIGPGSAGRATVGVILGARSSTLGALSELPVDNFAFQVLAADVTRDQNPDILVVRPAASNTSVSVCTYAGNGRGAFANPLCTDTPGFPNHFVIADINRDGSPDLVALRSIDSLVITLLGNGAGGFRVGPTLNVPSPGAIAVADFNGDSNPDLVIYSNSGLISLALGDGQGGFRLGQQIPASPGGVDVVALDLNRDGRPDVLALSSQGQSLSVYLNTGAGLGAAKTSNVPTPPRALMLTNTDASGPPSIWCSTAAGIFLIRNDGAGNLTIPQLPAVSGQWGDFAVGDFNNDGLLDMAAVGFGQTGGYLALLLGQVAATQLVADSPVTSAVYGQSLTINASLFGVANAIGSPAGGTLQLLEGGTPLQTAVLGPVLNPTVFPMAPIGPVVILAQSAFSLTLPVGTHNLSVFFPGNAAFSPSTSLPVPLTIQPAPAFVRAPAGTILVQRESALLAGITIESTGAPVREGIARLQCGGATLADAVPVDGRVSFTLPRDLTLGPLRCRVSFTGSNFLPGDSGDFDVLVQGKPVVVGSARLTPQAARDSIATILLPGLKVDGKSADTVDWPETLSGVQVEFADIKAKFAYAGPNQLNFLIPALVPSGDRPYRVRLNGADIGSGIASISEVGPGIYTANGSGSGAPAALAGLYRADGTSTPIAVFDCSPQCVPAAMPLGAAGETLIVSLYATGLRNAKTTIATAGAVRLDVLFAGPHQSIPGLDQVNVRIGRDQIPSGEFDLLLTSDGIASNRVRLSVR